MHNKYIHGKAKYHSLLEKTMKEDRNLKKTDYRGGKRSGRNPYSTCFNRSSGF